MIILLSGESNNNYHSLKSLSPNFNLNLYPIPHSIKIERKIKMDVNTCINCGVIIEEGFVHCNNCRNKYRV